MRVVQLEQVQVDRLAWVSCLFVASILAIGLGTAPKPAWTDFLFAKLEQRFPRPAIGNVESLMGVIALGGDPNRVVEAARLAHLYPHLKIIVTGEGTRSHVLSVLGPGISPDRVTVEEAARNTYENADAKLRGRWLLVTAASHMPRAIGTFRKNGFEVYPWPILEKHEGFPVTEVVRHEYIGLLAYWLLGRSTELFPSAAS
jgi:DUF218 domain